MRIKCECDDWRVQFPGSLDYRLMAFMNTVKDPDDHGGIDDRGAMPVKFELHAANSFMD